MTLNEIIESVKLEMCEDYCKYTNSPVPEGKTEDWLLNDKDSPCGECPLNKL